MPRTHGLVPSRKKEVVSRKLGTVVRYSMTRIGLRSRNSWLRPIFQYFILNYAEAEQPPLLYAVE
jgi:hypothetical protein